MLRQVARIYYRDETNFGVGHSNIVLNGFSLDISTMKFLEFKNNDAIYLRNAQKWKVYQLNEIEFMIDTYTNDSAIYPYLFNSYEIRISWFHEYLLDKNFDKVELSFNISFTDSSDMNLYFIGDSKNKSIINSYGDPSFKIRLNDYYMGPNLIFGFELISSVPYGPNITLPKVFNTYDKSIYEFQLNSNYPWNRVLSSRFTQKNNPIVQLSLQCINDNYIERYSFTTFGQNVKYEEQKEYLTSYFIDYYITVDSIEYFNNKRILVILSKEKERYFSHIFEIQNEKIFWIDKMIVDTYHKNLREAKPIVPLAKTGWVVLIDETEKELFFEPEDPKKMPYFLHSDVKVMYAYTVFGDQLYVSHYNDTKVSIYKVYRYENEEQKSTISIEFVRKYDFEKIYSWFDVDVYGLALAFIPNSNNIYLYQIKTIFEIKFVRIINFYVFLTHYKFLTNRNEHDIVYTRKASYVYIVMWVIDDKTERTLFIFDLDTISHNSLKSIIRLDKKIFSGYVNLLIDMSEYSSIIFIYIFTDNNYFRLINFEPENSLRK